MNKWILALSLMAGATTAVAIRHYTLPAPEIVRVEVLGDGSLSQASRCEDLVRLARRGFERVRLNNESAMSIRMTGSQETALEPVPLPVSVVPFDRFQVMEGRNKQTKLQDVFFESVRSSCLAVRPSTVSPVYLGLRRAVESLAAAGDSVTSRVVLVNSDLQETADTEIRRALRQMPGQPLGRLPSRIDNTGIDVFMCGYAATNGMRTDDQGQETSLTVSRTAARADRLLEVWRTLFSDPARVHFEPFCE